MRVNLTFNDNAIRDKFASIERDLPSQLDTALYATAQYGENIILDRTKRGIGVNGAFQPYSPKYAEFRRKKGRNNRVDLNFTGQMLGSMTATKNRGYAEIRFSRSTESKKAYFNNKRREFFGFNKDEKRRLVEFMKKRLFA